MSARIDVFDGATGALVEGIEAGIEGVSDFRPLWEGTSVPGTKRNPARKAVIRLWADSRKEMYQTTGSSIGAPWGGYRKRERQYVAFKTREFGRPVTDADQLSWDKPGGRQRLKPSLTDPGNRHFIKVSRAESLTLGSSLAYASDHENGGKLVTVFGRRYRLPKRPILPLGQRFIETTRVALSQWAGELGQAIELKTADVVARLRASGQL